MPAKSWRNVQSLLDVGVQVFINKDSMVLRHDGSAAQTGACQNFRATWPGPPAVQLEERRDVAGGFEPVSLWSRVEALLSAGVLVNFSAQEIELVYFDGITGQTAQQFDQHCAQQFPALNVTTRLLFQGIPDTDGIGGFAAALTRAGVRTGMVTVNSDHLTTLTLTTPPASIAAARTVNADKIDLNVLKEAGLRADTRGGSRE